MTTTRRNILGVTVALLMVLTVLFVSPIHSLVGGAYPAGAANGSGTILFERQSHWYTVAPNGTHRHMLLASTGDCSDFGCAAFSPDGTRIMVAAQTPDATRITVAIVNTNGTGYHALPLPNRTLNLGPGVWAPSGTRVALTGWQAKKGRTGIYAVNGSNGKGLVRLSTSPDGHNDDPLAYSPDGSRLLFFHEAPPRMHGTPLFGDLFETTAKGAGRVKLNPPGTRVTADFGSPGSWSPNGRQITFTAFATPLAMNAGISTVFVADANGSHLRRITPWGQWSTSARWSPDGTWILFDKVHPAGAGFHDLFLVHPDGTGLRAITTTAQVGECCAVWSPDGTKLLFEGKGTDLWVANRDGSGLVRLSPRDTNHETAEYAWGR